MEPRMCYKGNRHCLPHGVEPVHFGCKPEVPTSVEADPSEVFLSFPKFSSSWCEVSP